MILCIAEKPSVAKDIAEIHFNPKSTDDRPTVAIAQMAKDNGIDLYVGGKKVNPDDIINAKDPRSQRLQDLDSELTTALKTNDFGKVSAITDKIDSEARRVKLAPGESDAHLKLLYEEAGYDRPPTVVSKAKMDQISADGATLMTRGVAKTGTQTADQLAGQFRSGDYFTGNGIYGNGTYVGATGKVQNDRFVHGNDPAMAKAAFNNVAKYDYSNKSTANLRMALPGDARVITHTQIGKDLKSLETGIDTWSKKSKSDLKNAGLNPKQIAKDEAAFKAELSVRSAGFIPDPFMNQKTIKIGGLPADEGSLRFPKKDGSGFVELRIAKSIGDSYHVKDENGRYGPMLTKAAATKQALAQLANEHALSKYDKVKMSDVKIKKVGVFDDTVEADIPGYKKPLRIIDIGIDPAMPAWQYTHPTTGLVTYGKGDSKAALKKFLDNEGLIGPPVDPKKIQEIDRQVASMKRVLMGDNGNPPSSGRFATIRGYDAIALERSYQPDVFMNLLNRSKVIVQDANLTFKDGKAGGLL